jgi:hypothetical protein
MPKSNPISHARHNLAEALLDVKAAQKRHAAAREPLARLEAEIAAADAASARLSAMDADYAARMAAWAQTGQGPAPEPSNREAPTAAAQKGEAARRAMTGAAQAIAEAARQVAVAEARIAPAIAAVLREDGAALTAEYWRRYGALERVRRELEALDSVLIADFPITHAATGRPVADWLSPAKLSAPAALNAAEAACAGAGTVETFAQGWRLKAAELRG